MQEINHNYNSNITEDEIDLLELFRILLDGKWIILSITSISSIAVVIYSLMLPNIFESKSILVSTDSFASGSISNTLSNYSGLASLAGINLPSQKSKSNSQEAIMKINTLSFFKNNIMPYIFIPDLVALESWEKSTNTLYYNNDLYDKDSNKWINESEKPTAQESFRIFQEHFEIFEDKKNNFITLSIKHQSPFIAKEWSDLLVKEINSFYRKKDKLESQKAVNYLNAQISTTNLSEIKLVIAQLLQQETQKLTLIEANESYVFEFIDPPAVMERKVEPRRALICIIGALLGGVFSIIFVIIKYYFFRKGPVLS